jgi:hypothetical protein
VISRLVLAALLAASLQGCLTYEYEHEFWLRVDGSGTVYVTGRPELWAAFKGLGGAGDPEATAVREAARALFASSGLRVRRVTITHRGGRAYLFVSAEFEDVNKIAGTSAFPDLRISLRPSAGRLVLEGQWRRPPGTTAVTPASDGLIAVRFHLPSKVYEHRNAVEGVERGNILSWRQDVGQALGGRPLAFGATLDRRSILWSTVALFASAIVGALALLALVLAWVTRLGRRRAAHG